jgi:uncharacterized protein YyaL (SSP411 family)
VLADLRRRFFPNKVLAGATDDQPALLAPLLAGKTALGGEPTLFACEAFACQVPVKGAEAIATKLDELTRSN